MSPHDRHLNPETENSGLQDERNEVDVWISVKFDLLCSFCHVTWAGVLAAATRAGLLQNGETMATSRYVVEPL